MGHWWNGALLQFSKGWLSLRLWSSISWHHVRVVFRLIPNWNYKTSVWYMSSKPCYSPARLHGVRKEHTTVIISKFVRWGLRHSFFLLLWRCDPMRVIASSFLRFLDHTQRRTTVGRTPLDEWSVRRRDLYLTTYNTHNRQHIHAPGGIRT